VINSDEADAYPRLDGSCHTGVETFNYRIGSGFTAAQLDDIRDGIEAWDGVRDRSGSVMIDSNEGLGIWIFSTTGSNRVTCSGGLATRMYLNPTNPNIERSARHETGHAHGLSHSGNDDSLSSTGGTQQPQMDGCFAANGGIRNDDRAQYAHERDATFTAGVGFENGSSYYTGTWVNTDANPYQGSRHASVSQGNAVYSNWTRITTPPVDLRMRTRYKGGGTDRIKFEYRSVNYPSGTCNAGGTFNPNTFNWNNPTLGPVILHDNDALASSPNTYSFKNTTVPRVGVDGFAQFEGVDVRVQVYSEAGGNVYVDNLEVV
jgi:hypothetical protein